MLEVRPEGLYCPAGDFFIDPWQPVPAAVVTHAHSDHARWGCRKYLCASDGLAVLKARLGDDISVTAYDYGKQIKVGNATVSLHPAGHILGSAQVRVEVNGEIWVVSGDYKTERDETCAPWEPVKCHGFVTETTFGLPVYQWRPQAEIFQDMATWHTRNVDRGIRSVVTAYALGKAQRVMAGLAEFGIPFVVHGALTRMNQAYAESGIALPPWQMVSDGPVPDDAMVICPPSATGSPWIRRFGNSEVAFASGWMAIRGIRRRRGVDRGFVLSDHVDWPSLMSAIDATGAETVWTTHGYAFIVARYLTERGLQAIPLETQFTGEEADDA